MTKKMIAIFMSVLMLVMSMAVSATETEHVHEGCCCEEIEDTVNILNEGIAPLRVEYCQSCDVGQLILKTSYGTEIKSYRCTHNTSIIGTDYYTETTYYEYYQCNFCGVKSDRVDLYSTLSFKSCTNGYTSAP